jgi:PilZ domain
MTDDRRRFARIGFDVPAWIECAGSTPQAVTVIDLSFKGALVSAGTPGALVAGQACALVVAIGQDGEQIQMEAEVRHVDGPLLGLACASMDLDSMTHLRQLMALNLGDPALLERDLKALIAG